MEIESTALPGVVLLKPRVFHDARGYFYEAFSQRDFHQKVAPISFVQDNVSHSSYGVVRGLHFQLPPHAQSKLVQVLHGKILDVAVDIRVGSPTFGKHVSAILSQDNHHQLFIPRGFAHGFVALSDEVIVSYKCDNHYCKEAEGAIIWNDPALQIQWSIESQQAILSPKDLLHPTLQEAPQLFEYEQNLYP